ncbi:MAG: site-specific integrase [Prevotella sp.]|nr:site-specific integrase [Prevotella sp.]
MKEEKTFNEVYDAWYRDKRNYVKQTTISSYVLTAENHLIPRFGEMTSLSEQEVQDFVLEKLQDGFRQKTVRDMLAVLKMIVRYGCRMGYYQSTPWDIRFPKDYKKDDLEVMSIQHQRRLINYLKTNITTRNLGIILCLNTGVRIGELCALKWRDIDTRSGVVKVQHTLSRVYKIEDGQRYTNLEESTPKTLNSLREIPLSNDMLSLLKPLCKVMNKDFYILSNSKKPMEPRTLRNHFNSILVELNIPKIKFHGLRHCFATRCIESKCDYKMVSMILGHSNISTTLDLYVHPNKDQKKKCIEKMIRSMHF